MVLTEKRRNEIAYVLFVEGLKAAGLSNLDPKKIAKDLQKKIEGHDISFEEAQAFARELILPLVDEAFPKSKTDETVVSLVDKISSTG